MVVVWPFLIAAIPLGLEWSAPAGCPQGPEVQQEIEVLLGRALEGPRVVATASISGPPWRGDLVLGGERRSLAGESCGAVAKGAALILAMHLESLPTDPPPPAIATATITSTSPSAPNPISTPEPGPRLRLLVGARIVGDLGGVGGPAPGLGVEVGVELGRWRLLLTGRALLPRSRDLGQGAGSRHGLYALGLRGCGAVEFGGPAALFACGVGELGTITGESLGVTQPNSANALWIAGGVEVGPTVLLSDRWALALPISILVPGQRPRFVIEPFGEVHRPGPIVGRLAISLEARWP